MNSAYRLYCRIATVVFVINTAYPVTTKLLEERLAEDWLHSVLQLCSALFGIYADILLLVTFRGPGQT